MHIGIDETGNFNKYPKNEIGVFTLVTITDKKYDEAVQRALSVYKRKGNFIKSKDIKPVERKKLLKYVSVNPEIKYTSLVVDLSYCTDATIKSHQEGQIEKLNKNLEIMSKDTNFMDSYVKDFTLLRNQIRKLSIPDYLKFYFTTELIAEWQQYFQFDYVYTPVDRDSWELQPVLDTQNKQEMFKRIVISMLSLAFNEQNPEYSVFTPKEWDKEHPMIRKYDVEGDRSRIDARKLFSNLTIGSEKEHPIILYADFIGNLLYKSLNNPNTDNCKLVAKLRSNRSLTLTSKDRKFDFYKVGGFDKTKSTTEINKNIKANWDNIKKIIS